MDFKDLMTKLAAAAAKGDGAAVASCFCEDGVYHDVYYGAFKGREAIADMIENRFHRDGEDFIWDIHDPVSDGHTGYARYVFSYKSKLPEAKGARAGFEGVSVVRLRDGLIEHYSEIANTGPGLIDLGFPPERVCKILTKFGNEVWERDEAREHKKGLNQP